MKIMVAVNRLQQPWVLRGKRRIWRRFAIAFAGIWLQDQRAPRSLEDIRIVQRRELQRRRCVV
jgi:hypothetical protein